MDETKTGRLGPNEVEKRDKEAPSRRKKRGDIRKTGVRKHTW